MHYVTFHFLKHPKWFITAISLLWSWNSTPLFESKAFGGNVSPIFLLRCDVVLQVSLTRRLGGLLLRDENFTYHIWHVNKLNFCHARQLFDALRYTRADFELLRLVSARIDCEYSSRNYKEQHRKKKNFYEPLHRATSMLLSIDRVNEDWKISLVWWS